MPRTPILITELFCIFFALPWLIAHYWNGKGLVFILWGGFVVSFVALKLLAPYRFRTDWNWSAVRLAALKPILIRFCIAAVLLTAFTLWYAPERFLSFPRERPQMWMLVMMLYPILSVIPQEFIYRSYFHTRYAALLTRPIIAIAASGLAFGWMHVLLHNWIALSFSTIGGLLFAHTYVKNRSLALACIEHAFYGCYIFTIGLGWYFYHARFQS